MGSTSQNVLVVVAICFVAITAGTIISLVLFNEEESKPVTTEDWYSSSTASEEPEYDEPYGKDNSKAS